jgi:hypothetical protein
LSTFFKVLSLYLEASIRIRNRIKVKGMIRIRMRNRNTGLQSSTESNQLLKTRKYGTCVSSVTLARLGSFEPTECNLGLEHWFIPTILNLKLNFFISF